MLSPNDCCEEGSKGSSSYGKRRRLSAERRSTAYNCTVDVAEEVTDTPDKFVVSINVSEFTPEELMVTTDGELLVIEARHEENGSVKRSFVREFLLPSEVDTETLRSSLFPGGKLFVEADKKPTNESRTGAFSDQETTV